MYIYAYCAMCTLLRFRPASHEAAVLIAVTSGTVTCHGANVCADDVLRIILCINQFKCCAQRPINGGMHPWLANALSQCFLGLA